MARTPKTTGGTRGTREQQQAGTLIRQARQAGDLNRTQANNLTRQVLAGDLDAAGVAQALGIRLTPVRRPRTARVRRGNR